MNTQKRINLSFIKIVNNGTGLNSRTDISDVVQDEREEEKEPLLDTPNFILSGNIRRIKLQNVFKQVSKVRTISNSDHFCDLDGTAVNKDCIFPNLFSGDSSGCMSNISVYNDYSFRRKNSEMNIISVNVVHIISSYNVHTADVTVSFNVVNYYVLSIPVFCY